MTSGGAFRETRHSPQCVYRCMSGLVPRPDLLRSVAVGSVAHASTNSRRCRERGQPHTPPCRRRVSDTTGTPSESPVFLCHTRKRERVPKARVEGRGRHAGGMHAHDVGEREGRGPSHCPQGNLMRGKNSSKWWLALISVHGEVRLVGWVSSAMCCVTQHGSHDSNAVAPTLGYATLRIANPTYKTCQP